MTIECGIIGAFARNIDLIYKVYTTCTFNFYSTWIKFAMLMSLKINDNFLVIMMDGKMLDVVKFSSRVMPRNELIDPIQDAVAK